MCGITGIAALGSTLRDDASAIAGAMADLVAHRGPDASGVWADARVAFGHRRLAIVDLSETGAQPMFSRSGRLAIVFNGEIYNYRDLAARLRSDGWRSRGTGDTEVLLEYVERFGLPALLDAADGMFAFALHDRERNELTLVRDRFGEKPLHYCVDSGHVYFCSELRSLDAVPGLALSLDPVATADYFRFGYVTGRRTIFNEVTRLAPATTVTFALGTNAAPVESTYWRPPSWEDRRRTAGGDAERLREMLSTAVRNRLVSSDRPVGALLSGGIDSSVVCALAAEHATGALKTFTMGWEDAEYDESAQAARVASALGADHHDVRLERADVVAAVERLRDVLDEPFADSSLLAVTLVATTARRDVVVALSGDGGDEVFAGYNRHRWLLRMRRVQSLPRGVRRASSAVIRRSARLTEAAMSPISPTRRPRNVGDKLRKFAGALDSGTIADSYHRLLATNPTVGHPRALDDRVGLAMRAGSSDELLWALRVADLTGYMPDDVLTKVDRATMSVSLESRTPFLHKDVVELSLAMRADELVSGSRGKMPLRRIVQQALPGVPFDQSKMGFAVPVASLLRGELRGLMVDALTAHEKRSCPVDVDWRSMWESFASGDDAPTESLWALLMLELWLERQPRDLDWAEAPPVAAVSSGQRNENAS